MGRAEPLVGGEVWWMACGSAMLVDRVGPVEASLSCIVGSTPAPWLAVVALAGCADGAPGNGGDTDPAVVDGVDPEDLWEGCPLATPSSEAPDPYAWWATPQGLYCSEFSELRTFDEEADAKAQLRIQGGRVALGEGESVVPLTLCLREDPAGPVAVFEGEAAVDTVDLGDFWVASAEVVLDDGTGVSLTTRYPADEPVGRFDGAHHGPYAAVIHELSLCDGDCATAPVDRTVDSCGFTGVDLHRHTLTLDGAGEVELDIRIGDLLVATQPGILAAARGTLQGVDFEVTSYWDLVYTPEYHHLVRHARVVLPEPVGEVVALELEEMVPRPQAPGATVRGVDGAGETVATYTVTAETVEVLRPEAP